MTDNLKHIIFIVVLLVLAGGFYYLAQSDTIFKGHQRRSAEIASETIRLKKEVIAPLERLNDVYIETSFFTSVEYKALQDLSVILPDPSLNRENPFAPVPVF